MSVGDIARVIERHHMTGSRYLLSLLLGRKQQMVRRASVVVDHMKRMIVKLAVLQHQTVSIIEMGLELTMATRGLQ